MSGLLTLFEQHSYFILFIGIFLELLAIPISGEFLMSYAGYFVFQGKMNYILALLTVLFAGGAGITTTFWIGKAGGYRLIERYGKYIHLGPKRYQKMAAWFDRSGSKLLIFAYFIPGVRHFTGYVSGISKMPFRKFIIPAYTGSFLWGFCFITLGKILGPRWEAFHKEASKYLVIFLIAFAIVLIGFLIYRFYKIQIKEFFIWIIKWMISRFRTIRAAEVFLASLTVVLIGMVSLMIGLAQDYLYNEFTKFNQIVQFIVDSVFVTAWMKVFLALQSPVIYLLLIAVTSIRIWKKGRNRWLEYLLLTVSLLGERPFHSFIRQVFSYLSTFGIMKEFRSVNFPDQEAAFVIVIFGVCLFLLIRHSKHTFIQVFAPILVVLFLISIGIANIAFTGVLPSDFVGGYVYGGVWIFFNFLLFEMFRLVLDKANNEL